MSYFSKITIFCCFIFFLTNGSLEIKKKDLALTKAQPYFKLVNNTRNFDKNNKFVLKGIKIEILCIDTTKHALSNDLLLDHVLTQVKDRNRPKQGHKARHKGVDLHRQPTQASGRHLLSTAPETSSIPHVPSNDLLLDHVLTQVKDRNRPKQSHKKSNKTMNEYICTKIYKMSKNLEEGAALAG